MTDQRQPRRTQAHTPANDTPGGVIVTTPDQLRHVIRTELEAALEESGVRGSGPALLNREQIADALGCSTFTIDKLKRQGLPCFRVGDSPRFELAKCLEWFEQHKEQSA